MCGPVIMSGGQTDSILRVLFVCLLLKWTIAQTNECHMYSQTSVFLEVLRVCDGTITNINMTCKFLPKQPGCDIAVKLAYVKDSGDHSEAICTFEAGQGNCPDNFPKHIREGAEIYGDGVTEVKAALSDVSDWFIRITNYVCNIAVNVTEKQMATAQVKMKPCGPDYITGDGGSKTKDVSWFSAIVALALAVR